MSQNKFFAYIYRDPSTHQIRYAGYGTAPGRAYSVGHNKKIASVVENGEGFEILIAGPYRDEDEARNIEAALVSALAPDLNLIKQPGVKFRHLGVPSDLGVRRTLPPLSVHDVGRITGGAIIVCNSLTSTLKSGRPKVSPTNFDDETVFNNIRSHWYVKNFLSGWIEDPSSSPKVLIGAQGKGADRIIIGAARIDEHGWATTPTSPIHPTNYTIPLIDESGLDLCELRGRKIEVKFGAGKAHTWMLVNGDGLVIHGYRISGTRSPSEYKF